MPATVTVTATDAIAAHLTATTQCLAALDPADLTALVDLLDATARRGGRVYTCGNGGSAATAIHVASDLVAIPRTPAFDAVALSANVSALTAFANDVSFDDCFTLQLGTRVRPDDLLLAISCSGTSTNVLRALMLTRAAGASCAALLGSGGGAAAPLCDVAVVVDTTDPYLAEGVHDVVAHALVAALRR